MRRFLAPLLFASSLFGQQGLIVIPAGGASSGAGLVVFSSNVVLSGGTTPVYVPFGGGGLGDATEANVQVKAQPVATIRNLCVNLSVAPGMGDSVVFTLRANGGDEAVTVTIANTATAACDTVNTFNNGAGDLLDYSIVPSGTIMGYAPNVMISVEWGGAGSFTPTPQLHSITFVIDGGGVAIATGDQNVFPSANFSCTINKAMISADQSGSIEVDIWKANAAIPTAADIISASAPVTLSTAQLNQASSLAGWTLTVSPNDVFGFSVASATTVTRVIGQLWCQ